MKPSHGLHSLDFIFHITAQRDGTMTAFWIDSVCGTVDECVMSGRTLELLRGFCYNQALLNGVSLFYFGVLTLQFKRCKCCMLSNECYYSKCLISFKITFPINPYMTVVFILLEEWVVCESTHFVESIKITITKYQS